eukprot:TRINITY_DN37718_c0_g1_i1.p1 TRINITY_DN37718_c0_g1~~TRINITY_DN37718_c0_g1_i1.p1  ORF type:complete len:336 (-),score=51.55 TRINITY_DN37718_c0_g1_i1:124-1131(-)
MWWAIAGLERQPPRGPQPKRVPQWGDYAARQDVRETVCTNTSGGPQLALRASSLPQRSRQMKAGETRFYDAATAIGPDLARGSGPGLPRTAVAAARTQVAQPPSPSLADVSAADVARPAPGTEPAARRQRRREDSSISATQLSWQARPRSAPSLLRCDAPLLQSRPHRDGFLQHVEDTVVKECLGYFRNEGHAQRRGLKELDVLKDTDLFDLKVMHNSAQRCKTASTMRRSQQQTEGLDASVGMGKRGRQGDRRSWQHMSCPQRLRRIRQHLEEDVATHVRRHDAYEVLGIDRPPPEKLMPIVPEAQFALLRAFTKGLNFNSDGDVDPSCAQEAS